MVVVGGGGEGGRIAQVVMVVREERIWRLKESVSLGR